MALDFLITGLGLVIICAVLVAALFVLIRSPEWVKDL